MLTLVHGNGSGPIPLTSERMAPWGLPLTEAGTEEAAWHLWDVIEDGYDPPRSDMDRYQPAADLLCCFISLWWFEAEKRWRRWLLNGEATDKTAAHWGSESVSTLRSTWSELWVTVRRTTDLSHVCLQPAGRSDNKLFYNVWIQVVFTDKEGN